MVEDPGSEPWRELQSDLERGNRATMSVKAELEAICNTSQDMPVSVGEIEGVLIEDLQVLADQLTLMVDGARRIGMPFRRLVGAGNADNVRRECEEAIKGFAALRPGLSSAALAKGQRAVEQMADSLGRIGPPPAGD